jgi:hypothetical protein
VPFLSSALPKKIFLATGAAAFSLFLAEVGLRALAALKSEPSLVQQPDLGWDSSPSLKKMGDSGGGPPVLFLGDSFTQNNHWPELAVKSLGLPGINAGAMGFGTCQQLRKLQKVLETERPCLVVLQFYAWNDLRDNWAWPALGYNPEMLARPYLSPEGREFWPDYPWKWLDEFKITSYFGKRSLVRAWQKADRVMRSEGIDLIATRQQTLVAGLCADEAWQPFYRPDQQGGAYVRGAWQVTEACFLKIRESCQERKIPLLVLALDAPFTVDQDKWTALNCQMPSLERDLPLQRLKSILSRQNIPAVFPQNTLREWNRTSGQPAYDGESKSLIGHLTPGAQEVVAGEVMREAGKLLGERD